MREDTGHGVAVDDAGFVMPTLVWRRDQNLLERSSLLAIKRAPSVTAADYDHR